MRSKTVVVAVLAVLATLAGTVTANGQTAEATLSSSTCPGTGCLAATIETTGQIAISITGTFDGTIVFERTVDGESWTAWSVTGPLGLRSTTVTTGVFTGTTDGSAQYRIRFSLYWSGSATVAYNFLTSGAGNFTASYVVGQADESLTNAQVLGELTAGLLKVSVSGGVSPTGTLSTATAGTDYLSPTGLGTGVQTWLGTPSSANLLAALTTKTGTGNAVFSDSPTLVTPNLGTPSAAVLTNASGLPIGALTGLGTGVQTWLGTPSSANLLAALTTKTGTGNAVFGTGPTLSAPTIDRIANLTTNGVIVTTNGDGTLAIGSALPACSSGESPLYTSSWGCATLANTAGSYSNPSWITGLAWSKVTGTPTTISGYGITDAVSTGGSYANPAWITALAWSKITSTPTTVSGYGITDIYAKGTLTDSAPINFSMTWDDATEAFEGLKFTLTRTNNLTGSTMLELVENSVAFERVYWDSGQIKSMSKAYQRYWCPTAIDGPTTYHPCWYWQITPGTFNMALNPTGPFELELGTKVGARKLAGLTFTPTVTGDGTKDADSWDLHGTVVSTVTGSGTITITFQNAYATAPDCFVQNNTTANAVTYTASTTALVISGTFATSDRISYACFGR